MKELTHISLFAGIGGIDLAAEWAGFTTILMVEIDPYCQKVLNKHWPKTPIISDIRDVNIDTIANICYNNGEGGEPCECVANAKQNQPCQGKHGKDTYVENATIDTRKSGGIGTETSGKNIQIVGKNPSEMKSSNIMGGNVSVAEKTPQSSLPLTTDTTMVVKNENDTIKSRCGKLSSKEDSQMITKSSVITAITQKKSTECAPIKETSEDIRDVTKEVVENARGRGFSKQDICSQQQGGAETIGTGQGGLSNNRAGIIKRRTQTISPITLITGGFPCQPVSHAGKRRGKEDDRWLWPEMFRVISEIRPTWVVAENVTGLLNMGFNDCISDLESAGYETTSFLIPACGVNAPHRRDRIFIVAHSLNGSDRGGRGQDRKEDSIQGKVGQTLYSGVPCRTGDVENAGCLGSDRRAGQCRETKETGSRNRASRPSEYADNVADTQTIGTQGDKSIGEQEPEAHAGQGLSLCGGAGTGADQWAAEPELGRVAHGIPNRVDRLKCLGNAVVPQQIYPILKAIADIERVNAH